MSRATMILALCICAAACSYVREITDDHSSIADPRQRWHAYEIEDYEFQIDYLGGIDTLPRSIRIRVELGRGVKMRDLLLGRTYGKGYSNISPTIRDLFSDIERYRKNETLRFRVDYDARLGYPRHVDIVYVNRSGERGERSDTHWIHYRVSDFQALDLDY